MGLKLRFLTTSDSNFQAELNAILCLENNENDESIAQKVEEILTAVRLSGDAAVLDFTNQFDHIRAQHLNDLQIPKEALKSAYENLPTEIQQALNIAALRIRTFHERQMQYSWEYIDELNVRFGQNVTPLNRVGLYVPGGKAAYPSSVLMNALPAKVAGVKELIMMVPTPNGEQNPLVLAAAHLANVDCVYTIGGAQAIAAMAYGTESLKAVDKIVGPGNAYVAEAKRQVFGKVGIDMIAGPSEILILADDYANPEWLAMDLFSQAEHDPMAQAILISTSELFIKEVSDAMRQCWRKLPRANIIEQSIARRGALIHTQNLEESIALANRIAPEHLELALKNAQEVLPKITNAGAIFVGHHSCESLGDYCAGPNHVLPTSGSARFSSPLGVYDFQKRTSLIEIPPSAAQKLGQVAFQLANGEGLFAHAEAARCRLSF